MSAVTCAAGTPRGRYAAAAAGRSAASAASVPSSPAQTPRQGYTNNYNSKKPATPQRATPGSATARQRAPPPMFANSRSPPPPLCSSLQRTVSAPDPGLFADPSCGFGSPTGLESPHRAISPVRRSAAKMSPSVLRSSSSLTPKKDPEWHFENMSKLEALHSDFQLRMSVRQSVDRSVRQSVERVRASSEINCLRESYRELTPRNLAALQDFSVPSVSGGESAAPDARRQQQQQGGGRGPYATMAEPSTPAPAAAAGGTAGGGQPGGVLTPDTSMLISRVMGRSMEFR